MRQRLGTYALMLGALTVSLLLAEALTRVFVGDHVLLYPRYHASADYGEFTLRRLRPNTVFWHTGPRRSWKFVTNTQGFRDDRDWVYEKPPGTLRVLTVGDSHTLGFEVEQDQTYSAVIERVLRSREIDAEVLNAGVSGFSTAEIVAFLEEAGVEYRPDAVVYGFFANDFEDNIKAGLFELEEDELVNKRHEHIPGVKILQTINVFGPFRWLSENSYLYNLGLNTVWNSAKRMLLSDAEEELLTEFAIPTEAVSSYKKALMTALLRKMYEVCQRQNIKLVILDIPQLSDRHGFKSSIPQEMVKMFASNSDSLILSGGALSTYRGVFPIHVADGQRHISEFTHGILGIEAAEALMSFPQLAKKTSLNSNISR